MFWDDNWEGTKHVLYGHKLLSVCTWRSVVICISLGIVNDKWRQHIKKYSNKNVIIALVYSIRLSIPPELIVFNDQKSIDDAWF